MSWRHFVIQVIQRFQWKQVPSTGIYLDSRKIDNPRLFFSFVLPFQRRSYATDLHCYAFRHLLKRPYRTLALKKVHEIDWHTKGALQNVLKQTANDCWALAAVNATQSLLFILYGRLFELSYEELRDRVACKSRVGYVDLALDFIRSRGLSTMDTYRHTHVERLYIDSWNWIPSEEIEKILVALEKQPLIARIVVHKSLLHHCGKIYTGPTLREFKRDLESDRKKDKRYHKDKNVLGHHFFLIVGYEVIQGLPYLKLQNSWGREWGWNGYFYIPVFTSWERRGMLNLFTSVVYPTVSEDPNSPTNRCNKLVINP